MIAAFVVMMVGMVFTAPRYLRYFVMIVMLAPFMSGGIQFKPTVAPIMALVILHTRMMYETAKAKRGGRPYRPRLIAFTAPHFRAGLAR